MDQGRVIKSSAEVTALEILKKRYASEEIDREQFETMKRDLTQLLARRYLQSSFLSRGVCFSVPYPAAARASLSSFEGLTEMTGQVACRTTCSVTLPISMCKSPVLP